MRAGKLSQTVWKRSVFKQLHTKRDEFVFRPSIEEVCTAQKISSGALAVTSAAYVTGQNTSLGFYAAAKAVNDLAAAGAAPVGISLGILFPPGTEEPTVKALIGETEEFCKNMKIQITAIQAEVNPAVSQIVIHAEVHGEAEQETLLRAENVKAGQDIVLCGSIGLEGILRIVEEREEELKKRFVPAFLHQIKELKKEIVCADVISEVCNAALDGKFHIADIQQIGSGGILAALWEFAEAAGTGLQADMARMTICQETVEICEYYQLNPYQMTSAGAFLIAADKGDEVVKLLRESGARAVKLGVATAEKARVITSGEEKRYLDRPGTDELIRWQAEQIS